MVAPTHLKSLQALELAMRTRSLKRTAEILSVTPAAVGQRIKSLEDYLGFDLVVRGRSGIQPTRELQEAIPNLGTAFSALERVADILDFQRVHEIHIVADSDLAELWLAPRLPAFRSRNPNIRFCINGVGDVPARIGQADCEIRFGEAGAKQGGDLLFHDFLLPVSSHENTRRISAQPEESRLEGFPLVHLTSYAADPSAAGWPDWIRKHGHRETGADRGIRYSKIVPALEAVHSNVGLLICGLAMVLPKIENGGLSLPFAPDRGAWTSHAYQASFRGASLRRRQISRFRDWLVGEGATTETELRRITRA